MEIVVGSENTPKRQAVTNAFRQIYPSDFLEVHGVAAESGVSDHPTTAEESWRGAEQRVRHARELKPDADFYVGIEGGLSRAGERAYEHSYVVIGNREGELGTAMSAGLELSGKLLSAVLNGQELSHAFAEQHGVAEAGKKNGLYGMATDDLVTREGATEQAVIFASARFIHPEYFQ